MRSLVHVALLLMPIVAFEASAQTSMKERQMADAAERLAAMATDGVFRAGDRNRDGFIDRAEMTAMAASRGRGPMTPGEWSAMDADHDGRGSRQEIHVAMKHQLLRRMSGR